MKISHMVAKKMLKKQRLKQLQ